MKTTTTLITWLAMAAIAAGETIALVNGTVVDPASERMIANATVVIDTVTKNGVVYPADSILK
jgi:hypothetical protein